MESIRRCEMADCCATDCNPKDLTTRKTAWLLWCLPSAGVLVGFFWAEGRAWIWIPAFLVMGGGCLANATRCGRLHCYFTGPLYILAALPRMPRREEESWTLCLSILPSALVHKTI